MPQARSSGSSSGRSQTKRSSASKSTGAKRTTRKTASSKSSASKARASRAGASASSGAAGAKSNGTADPRLEALAERVRKLNERIIDESKTAGEATLTAYEKALKAIASSLERGPGKSDVEWISSLATTQAKWIRDVTAAWTSAARGMLK
ncbi:MAG TPA: hypothetical protein VMA96_07770 [Solirubrobacteraceae bacterium]|nr:hypothetical protein [Solirubrobacteraceae bacterium]